MRYTNQIQSLQTESALVYNIIKVAYSQTMPYDVGILLYYLVSTISVA